jgi:hypothetical protein
MYSRVKGVERFKSGVQMVHSVHNLDPRILPARHVDNVDNVTNDCPQCPQTVVYTVVYMHTVLCTMGSAGCRGQSAWSTKL